jgi:hypothetical protein
MTVVYNNLLDGSAYHLSASVVLQHQVEPSANGPHAGWQAGLPVPEEATLRAQVSHDRSQAQGYQAYEILRTRQTQSPTQEGLQSLRR